MKENKKGSLNAFLHNDNTVGYIFAAPFIIGFCCFTLIPMALFPGETGAMTQPIGLIPESARVWFEDFEEEDGTIHEYLYAEVLLWKRQEAYRKIIEDGITAHSMELTVKSGKMVDGIYHIEDFEFTAFALIGVEPCFEGSALETFSKQVYKRLY